MKITSVSNELIKNTSKLLQKKYRDETKLFLLEGTKCVEEAISSGIEVVHIFVSENQKNTFGKNCIETTEKVMSKISSTDTPPKAVAVAKQPKKEWSEKFKKVVLLEDIKDAGNLGTILRTACAFSVDAVILYGDTVDLYNPKCVRSAVGNLWKIPVFNLKRNELGNIFDDFEKVATLPNCENTVLLNKYIPKDKILLMFGTESSGLSAELKKFADKNITIEMSENVESLNLSISAGIIMYNLFSK